MLQPFECKPVAYQISGADNSELQEINLVTGSVKTIKVNIGIEGNALAYNVQDNYLYAINNIDTPRQVYRIAADGSVEAVGSIPNLPQNIYNVGTMDDSGYYYVLSGVSQIYYTIDFTNINSPTYGRLVDPTNGYVLDNTAPFGVAMIGPDMTGFDWAYNPVDKKLYSINSGGNVLRVDPLTGQTQGVVTTGVVADSYGAVYFDQNGRFYAIRNSDGQVLRINDVTGSSAVATNFSQATASQNNDGASCINSAIDVDFGDAPDTSSGNGAGNYTTLISNNGPRHQIVNELFIGNGVTAELDALQNSTATGDLDDGLVAPLNVLIDNTTFKLTVPITNNTGTAANVYAWIDFNSDGIFQTNESATAVVPSSTNNPQNIDLVFNIPVGATVKETFTRIRVTTDNLVNTGGATQQDTRSIGPASDGEVEDYQTFLIKTNITTNKTVSAQYANLGDVLTYTVTLTNTSSTTINNVSFQDDIPAGTTYADNLNVSTAFTGINPQTGLIITSINANEVVTISWNVTVNNTLPILNPISNIATITETGQPQIKTNVVTTQINNANLTPLLKSVDKTIAQVGDELTYTLNFTNTGNVNATNVKITDPIPTGTTYVDASLTGNVAVTGSPITTINLTNPVVPGQSISIKFRVKVTSIPNLNLVTNKADIVYSYKVDPNAPDIIDTATSNEVTTQINQGELVAVKSVNKSFAGLGETIRYTVTLSNLGNASSSNVLFQDASPIGTTYDDNLFVSVPFTGIDPQSGITITTINPGQLVTIAWNVKVKDNLPLPIPNPIENIATITEVGKPSIKTNKVTTQINAGELSPITKNVDKVLAQVGEIITYTISFTNTGNVDVTGTKIFDQIPNGGTYVSGSLISNVPVTGNPTSTINIANSITPGQTVIISFKVQIDSIPVPNPMKNIANVVYAYKIDSNAPDIIKNVDSNEVATQVAEGVLITEKLADKTYVQSGEIIRYTVNLSNIGNGALSNVVFKDEVPVGTIYANNLSVSTIYTGIDPQTGLTIKTINSNEVITISWDVKVNDTLPVSGVIKNIGTAAVPGKAPITTNEVIIETKEAKIENATKSVDKKFADIGDIITYNITFRNNGNIPASEVVIVDPVPIGTSYVENSLVSNVAIAGSPLTNIALVNSLLPGQSVILAFKVKVEEITAINPIPNKATIDYEYTVDPQKLPIAKVKETNVVTTEVKHGQIPTQGADAALKTADREITTPGETITYTIKAKNTGNTPVNNVVVKDVLPVGTSFVAGSTLINGEPSGQNPIIGINVGTVLPNVEFIIKFKALVLDNALDKIVNDATINYEYIVDPNLPLKKQEINTNKVIVDNLSPEIKIVKTADKEAVILGEIIKYSLEVSNNGEVTALDLIIKDLLPTGLEYANNLAINGIPFNGDITLGVNISSLAPEEKVVISFNAKVVKIGGGNFEFINKAVGTYNYQVQPGGTVFAGETESNEVKIKGFETLVSIQKNTNKELVKLGDIFTYTIKVKNESELDAENVLLKDVLPQELEIQEVKINGVVVTGDLEKGILAGPLAKGKEIVITITVKAVDQLDEPFKNIINASLFVRPDPNRQVVEIKASAKDEGIMGRDSNVPYLGVVVVQPNLKVIKTTSKSEVAVGDIVKYTLNIENTGNVDAREVVVRDIINDKLKFIAGSVVIDGVSMPTEDILLGISIDLIKINEKTVITFDTEVLESGTIPNQAVVEYIYKSETNGIDQASFNESNVSIINANDIKLDVKKTSDKDFAVLRDEIKYIITIQNKTNVVANNIIVRDELPRYIELISGSFKLNGQTINTVNLDKGVNIGILKPEQKAIIEYRVKVVSNSCTSIIENGVEVSYNYILPDGSLGKTVLPAKDKQTNTIQMGMANFKQFSIESYLSIPDVKPDIETINNAKGTIDVTGCHVIKTSPNISNEGQYLTGHKLVVSGYLNFVVEYTALNSVQAVYSAHYNIPFSTFVVLPEDYTVGSKIDVQGVVEDIYFKLVNEREFFTNVTTLINVKILFC